ncbi:MAG TPA: family 1 glycosylhydrolase, partial [Gemmatimonadales bacterium]|nr:family 1 glycosylhydrolase [Gemmatimonadales bacterium]
GADWPVFPEADFALISEPLDFLGINYYTRGVMRSDPEELPLRASKVRQERALHTTLDWEVYPATLTEVLAWVSKRYGPVPLYITENGAAFEDPPETDATLLPDPLRVQYLEDHLRAAHQALRQGVDLRGYFAWSLLDNFEWSAGYSHRFGLYHVNFATQQRTPKASARFYADVIASHGEVLSAGR